VIPQVVAEGESLEGKDATELQKIRKAGSQHDVQIKIEATVPVNRQIPEEIISLDVKPKGIKDRAVLREFLVHECLYPVVVKKQIFIIRI
jgi:hypothetical protein